MCFYFLGFRIKMAKTERTIGMIKKTLFIHLSFCALSSISRFKIIYYLCSRLVKFLSMYPVLCARIWKCAIFNAPLWLQNVFHLRTVPSTSERACCLQRSPTQHAVARRGIGNAALLWFTSCRAIKIEMSHPWNSR